MYISLGWIYGLMFGIEAFSSEQCAVLEVAWGIIIDIGIVRMMITYDYSDTEYFDEEKAA